MRWKIVPEPKVGDRRIVSYFAWLPVGIGGEVRWLERVTIEQIYRREVRIDDQGYGYVFECGGWVNLDFMDNPYFDLLSASPSPSPSPAPDEPVGIGYDDPNG